MKVPILFTLIFCDFTHLDFLWLQSSFFNREDQALPGFSKFFRKASDEERDHAMKLIEYQNMRGGKVVFKVNPFLS